MKLNLLRILRFALLLPVSIMAFNMASAQPLNATVKVDKNIIHQKITGFGGFVNSPQFGYNYMTEAEIRKMWGPNSEAGYNIMRMYIPMGEDRWPQTVATAVLANSLGIKIFASPWSMPTAWKTFNTVGSFYNDANGVRRDVYLKEEHYADYANYLNNFVLLMRSNGVELDAISIQNEPDYQVEYEGCIWTPAQMTKFLKENRHLISCKVMAPETVGITDNYSTPFNAADVLPHYDIYAGHQYGAIQNGLKNIQANGKEVWMSEFLINWNAGGGTRSFNYNIDAFDFANSVNNAMLANINAWVHYATKRYNGMMGDGTLGTPLSEISKRGRILSHYAQYVTGATRVESTFNDNTGQLKGSSYLSTTGDSITIVIINPSGNVFNLAVDLPFLSNFGKAVTTTQTTNMVESPVVFTQETNRPKVNIDPGSVTTLVFTKSGDLIPSQMTGEVVNYTMIDNLTPTSSAFGTTYKMSGTTAVFKNDVALISANRNANNGYLNLDNKYNRLVFRVESLTSAATYTSANTTLYYINNAGATSSRNYGTVTFDNRNNFDWVIDISEDVLTDGCRGILGISNGNFVSVLTFKFANVFFAVGSERGYAFAGPYSATDGSLLDCLDDVTYTSLNFTGVTDIPAQTNWDANATNKNAVYYVLDNNLNDKNNVVVGTTCNTLELRDMGGDFYPPAGFMANAARLRTTINGYKMLVLPFQANIPAGITAYSLTFSDARVKGTSITTGLIPANTPVLVKGEGSFEFTGSGAITPRVNFQAGITNGVYIGIRVPQGGYYLTFDANGFPRFTRSTSGSQPNITSFDAYLTPTGTTAATLQIELDGILPVSLGTFTAVANKNDVHLAWDTYAETNNNGFYIERSNDGSTFEKIGFVKGKGNSAVQTKYAFIDNAPFDGLNYYRLKQTDIDGAFNYSSVRSVNFGSKALVVSLYPNPASNLLTLDGNGNKLNGTLLLVDATGRIVLESKVVATEVHQVNISKLSPGIYFYRINEFKGTFIKR